MIYVESLTKRFGRTTAVDNISFQVKEGEIVGLLGPNGAGKTTTMRILAGYLPATGGRVTIAGLDVFTKSLAVRQRIGYLPENCPLYGDMRVHEYLRYRGRLKGLHGRRLRARIDDVVGACELRESARTVIGRLSKGFQQRVGLADALLHEPDVLILDEPTIGLDPNQIRHIRGLIRSLASRHTVLLSSHILPEVEAVCERVLILHEGRIAASGTPGKLADLLQGHLTVMAEIRGERRAVEQALRGIPGVLEAICDPEGEWQRCTCRCEEGTDIREALFAAAAQNGWRLRELRGARANLEDVFAAMTGEAGEPGES